MRMKKVQTNDIMKRLNRREKMDDLVEVLYSVETFFKRFFLLVKYAIFKVISMLTIPFFVIGLIGAFNFYKLIDDMISNGTFLADSIYLSKAVLLLGIYGVYHFIKMGLDCNLYGKK